jgi:hypothetical protein
LQDLSLTVGAMAAILLVSFFETVQGQAVLVLG